MGFHWHKVKYTLCQTTSQTALTALPTYPTPLILVNVRWLLAVDDDDDYDDDYDYGDDDDYDYDKGFGYTAPKPGQSFSDYVKEQDPDLYNSLFG